MVWNDAKEDILVDLVDFYQKPNLNIQLYSPLPWPPAGADIAGA